MTLTAQSSPIIRDDLGCALLEKRQVIGDLLQHLRETVGVRLAALRFVEATRCEPLQGCP
jgi:hypothetical protein